MVSILRKISDPLCFMMMKPCLDKSPGWCFPSPRGMKVYQDDQDLNCFMKRLKELVLSDEDLKGSQSSSLQLLEGVYKHHRTKLLVVGNGKNKQWPEVVWDVQGGHHSLVRQLTQRKGASFFFEWFWKLLRQISNWSDLLSQGRLDTMRHLCNHVQMENWWLSWSIILVYCGKTVFKRLPKCVQALLLI